MYIGNFEQGDSWRHKSRGQCKFQIFFYQVLIFSKGQFKDVLFYKEDVMKHVERKYHPGGK
jgi:hypothetical protein